MSQFVKPQGVCFLFDGGLSATILAHTLCRIVNFLQGVEPYATLQHYEDWWEHDGLHFYRGPADFNTLYGMVNSPRNLLASTPGDEYVFVGIAPEDSSWYLRFRVEWDDEGFDLSGRCAVILPAPLEEKFKREVLPNLAAKAEEKDSKIYYLEIVS